MFGFVVLLFICVIIYCSYIDNHGSKQRNKEQISILTDKWCDAIVMHNDPIKVSSLFCNDAILIGTVSKTKRKNIDILRYFEYFAKLPNIKIVSKEYNISNVSSNVYINTAFIEWMWDGLQVPVIARMTFIYRGNCIYLLHSSAMPKLNSELVKISGHK